MLLNNLKYQKIDKITFQGLLGMWYEFPIHTFKLVACVRDCKRQSMDGSRWDVVWSMSRLATLFFLTMLPF